MTDIEQEARAEAAKFVRQKHPEWHDRGVGVVQGSHYRSGFEDGSAWWASRPASPVTRETVTEEAARLREVWAAFGCAPNPDDFKPGVRAVMWSQVMEMARESATNSGRIVRENAELRALLAARETVTEERVERAALAHELWRSYSGSICGLDGCRYQDSENDADYECECIECHTTWEGIADALLAAFTITEKGDDRG